MHEKSINEVLHSHHKIGLSRPCTGCKFYVTKRGHAKNPGLLEGPVQAFCTKDLCADPFDVYNVVTGEKNTQHLVLCVRARGDTGHCRPEGVYFERGNPPETP